jgi:hypothetical protein
LFYNRLPLLICDSKLTKLVNELTWDISRTRVRFPPPPPYKENSMFNWFKKKEEVENSIEPLYCSGAQDEIEESLWEIKEEYDLPTEEINIVVESKRKNLQHMHKMISKKIRNKII